MSDKQVEYAFPNLGDKVYITEHLEGMTKRYEKPCNTGMTLRDWFAGMAMQGYMASDTSNAFSMEDIVSVAFEMADYMLKERSKNETH